VLRMVWNIGHIQPPATAIRRRKIVAYPLVGKSYSRRHFLCLEKGSGNVRWGMRYGGSLVDVPKNDKAEALVTKTPGLTASLFKPSVYQKEVALSFAEQRVGARRIARVHISIAGTPFYFLKIFQTITRWRFHKPQEIPQMRPSRYGCLELQKKFWA